MRLLVTGSRNWTDRDMVFSVLDRWHAEVKITTLIEGCARGADRLAGDHEWKEPGPDGVRRWTAGWAKVREIEGAHFPADWERFGKGAGPRRNSVMLADSEPEMVIAFSDALEGSGTGDMVRKARAWGLEVVHITHLPVPA